MGFAPIPPQARRLRESATVWLPDYAVAEATGRFGGVAGTAALTLALAKELSGEAHLARAHAAQAHECLCDHHADAPPKPPEQLYLETTEQRFTGVAVAADMKISPPRLRVASWSHSYHPSPASSPPPITTKPKSRLTPCPTRSFAQMVRVWTIR